MNIDRNLRVLIDFYDFMIRFNDFVTKSPTFPNLVLHEAKAIKTNTPSFKLVDVKLE